MVTISTTLHNDASPDFLSAIGGLYPNDLLSQYPDALSHGYTQVRPLLHITASEFGVIIAHQAIVELSSLPLVYGLSDTILTNLAGDTKLTSALIESSLSARSELPSPDFWLTHAQAPAITRHFLNHGFSHVDKGQVETLQGSYNPSWLMLPLPDPESELLLLSSDC